MVEVLGLIRRGLTNRWSGRVIDKVPSSYAGVRAAQLNRYVLKMMIDVVPQDEEELTRYVLAWYRQLLTDTELDALGALNINLKAVNVESVLVKRKLGDVLQRIQSPDVIAMLANGPDNCRRTIRDRLMREHRHEIVLVKCPQCNRLARTPNARMCVHCGHAWHRQEQT